MYPWFFPWWNFFKGPLSGDVIQSLAGSWLSPQFEFNFAGDPRIEADVIADVASYGKQLGILSEAVLELAEGEGGEKIQRLKDVTELIEKVKKCHRENLEEKVKSKLDQLRRQNPEALARILYEYQDER